MGWIARIWAAGPTLSPREGWLLGAWFGLLVGFVEIAHESVREHVFGHVLHHKCRHFVWMVPLSYLLLGLIVGSVIALVVRLLPRLATLPLAVFAFVFLGIWGQLLPYGSLHLAAVLALSGGIAWQCARAKALGGDHVLAWSRRTLPWMGAGVAVAGITVAAAGPFAESRAMSNLPPAPAGAPNVVLIVLDTVRVDHLSMHGYRRQTTPQIDNLAAEGVTFDGCISTSPWTLPAHVTMFTGLYPNEFAADWMIPFGNRHPTLAEAMAERGYATGGFVGNLGYCGRQNGIDRGFARYEDYYVQPDVFAFSSLVGAELTTRFVGAAFGTYLRNDAATVTDRFLGWARELEGRPFFAFLNYYDAHETYRPPEGFDRYLPDIDPGSRFGQTERLERHKKLVADYDGCITYIDHHIGRLMRELDDSGLLDNTLVIVTGDHGEMFGEQGLFGHAYSLYRPLLHVPLVFWSKRGLPRGRRIAEFVSLRDLPATILELTATVPSQPIPGSSLSHHWRPGPRPSRPSPLLSEVSKGIDTPSFVPVSGGDMQSLVEGPLQFITGGNRGESLYHLTNDPREETNLMVTEFGRRKADQMRSTIKRLIERP